MDVLNTTDQDYPVPMAPMDDEAYSASETEREAAFSGAYDLAESSVMDAARSPPAPPPSPVIVDMRRQRSPRRAAPGSSYLG